MWSYALGRHGESQGLDKTKWGEEFSRRGEGHWVPGRACQAGSKMPLPFSLTYIPAQCTPLAESWEASGVSWHLGGWKRFASRPVPLLPCFFPCCLVQTSLCDEIKSTKQVYPTFQGFQFQWYVLTFIWFEVLLGFQLPYLIGICSIYFL